MNSTRNRSHVIAVAGAEAGAGKTTVAVNLAASLFRTDCPILLLDLDPRADASRALGVKMRASSGSTYAALCGTARLSQLRLPTLSGIDLVPGHEELASLPPDHPALERALYERVREVASNYKWIFLDCPAGANPLALSALAVVHQILIPYQPETAAPTALEGMIAHVHGKHVYLVANQVAAQEATYPPAWHPEEFGPEIHFLGHVSYSALLRDEAYRYGLPPVKSQPDSTVARDFAELAASLELVRGAYRRQGRTTLGS